MLLVGIMTWILRRIYRRRYGASRFDREREAIKHEATFAVGHWACLQENGQLSDKARASKLSAPMNYVGLSTYEAVILLFYILFIVSTRFTFVEGLQKGGRNRDHQRCLCSVYQNEHVSNIRIELFRKATEPKSITTLTHSWYISNSLIYKPRILPKHPRNLINMTETSRSSSRLLLGVVFIK